VERRRLHLAAAINRGARSAVPSFAAKSCRPCTPRAT